jgi:hypothetical protein
MKALAATLLSHLARPSRKASPLVVSSCLQAMHRRAVASMWFLAKA